MTDSLMIKIPEGVMTPLAIIPARGGSKGLPGKNIKPLAGKPLITYTIDAAREVFPEEDICVSTDDVAIISTVEDYNMAVPFTRPAALASDNSGMRDVLLHAHAFFEQARNKTYDTIVLLQPTSPLRKGSQIREALQLFSEHPETELVVSVKETTSNPYYLLFEENEQGYLSKSKQGNFLRRQDCPKVYEFNGAIYVISVEALKKGEVSTFKKIRKYMMNEYTSVDIDTIFDWIICETILKMGLS